MADPAPSLPVPTFTGAAITHVLRRTTVNRGYPVGTTLAEVALELVPDPGTFGALRCQLNNHPVPRELWHRVQPKAGTLAQFAPMPGDGNQAARIGLTAVVVALAAAATVYTGGAAGPLVATLGVPGAAAAGAVIGAAIPAAGMLAVNALAPPA